MTGTVLYTADVSCLNDPALYARAYRLASPERREKTDRLRFGKDRNLSLGAWLLLRYALRRAGFSDQPELRYGENEKPYLKSPAGVFFSLSHSGTLAVCALSERETGCDIERLGGMRLPLARRFFCPEEVAALEKSADALDFYRIWTCKESFLKATGLGLRLPMDSFFVRLGNPPILCQSVNDKTYRLQEFSDLPGYACALCTDEPCGEAELHTVYLSSVMNP